MLRIPSTTYKRGLLTRSTIWKSGQKFQRNVHAYHLEPLVTDFATTLAKKHPSFSVSPECIRILSEPPQFYSLLLEMIRRAERRIFISSLYIGSSETELISTLAKRLRDKPSVQLHLLLDLNRSTRPGGLSTAKILLPLLREFPSQVHVSMFRSPSLRGLLAKLVPPRFNEGWGTWHAKIYGVDDEVMISGANLNKSYFTNRQDRYLHFNAQPELAQYCYKFMQTVAGFSYKFLLSTQKTDSKTTLLNKYSYTNEDYILHWPDPTTHPHHFNQKAEAAFSSLQASHHQITSSDISSPYQPAATRPANQSASASNHAILFPLIQAGQFNIREEETMFQLLFRHLNKAFISSPRWRPLLDLTSGYFSLYKPYQDLILGTPNIDCRIVAASPKANGFFGSNGLSGRIPEGYTLYEQRFMAAVKRAGRLWNAKINGGVKLSEWDKNGWTYHAKGIWLSPNSSSPPILTLFGSTNFNSRSAHLDTELSFLMLVPSQKGRASSDESSSALESDIDDAPGSIPSLSLSERLALEVQNIRSNTRDWQGGQRNVRFTTKIIVWLVKGML